MSDDPEPTDYHHFEIYTYNSGTAVRGDTGGATGIDFNYGAAPDLQLTATVPMGFDSPASGQSAFGLSNVELAAKYRFLHQDSFGLDVSVFPRVFLHRYRAGAAGLRRLRPLLPHPRRPACRDYGDSYNYAPRERYIERRGYYDGGYYNDGPSVGIGVGPGGVGVGFGVGPRW